MNTEQLASTIKQQIQACDPWALFAYASERFSIVPESSENWGGLTWKVSPRRPVDRVSVMLDYNDTYRVQFFENGTKVKEVAEVYCDQLVTVLDWMEKPDQK